MQDPLLSVIIPVFNEKNTCLELIQRVKNVKIQKQIIVINDGSTDGTEKLLTSIDGILLINREKNYGKGSAVRSAIPFCKGRYIILQDGDLEYDPNEYHKLIQPIIDQKADVVFGSRWLGKNNKNSSYHTLGNKMITWFSTFINGKKITDVASCYKVFPTNYFKELKLKSEGFGLETEIAAKVFRKGYVVKEVAVGYHRRRVDEGKKLRLVDGLISAWSCIRFRYLD